MQIKMIVACINAEGAPDFHTCQVEVSEQQQKDGEHYLMAYENAKWNGFVDPMVAYDEGDLSPGKLAGMESWIRMNTAVAAEPDEITIRVKRSALRGAGNTLFLVSGREPGDDDDTAELILSNSEQGASALYEEIINEYSSEEELDSLHRSHGTTAFINVCTAVGEVVAPPHASPAHAAHSST